MKGEEWVGVRRTCYPALEGQSVYCVCGPAGAAPRIEEKGVSASTAVSQF